MKETVIKEICHNKEYRKIIDRISLGSGLEDDLFQEVILLVLEQMEDPKKAEKWIKAYTDNYFKYYFVRIVLNTFKSKNSPFYYKFKKHLSHTDYNQDLIHLTEDEGYDHKIDELAAHALNELENFPWYNKELFLLYAELGTRTAVSASTQIPKRSVGDTVNLTKEMLKIKLEDKWNQS